MTRGPDISDALTVLGSGIVTAGLWQWSMPAALVFAGGALLALGILGIRGRLVK